MTGFPLRQTIKRRFLVTNLIEFCLLLVIGRRLQSALDRSRSKFSPPCQVADRYVPWVLARDFSCAVSGFGQVFIVTRPFLSRLRPSVENVSTTTPKNPALSEKNLWYQNTSYVTQSSFNQSTTVVPCNFTPMHVPICIMSAFNFERN